jgi:hypothetical protein
MLGNVIICGTFDTLYYNFPGVHCSPIFRGMDGVNLVADVPVGLIS